MYSDVFLVNPPLLPSLIYPIPLCTINHPLYLLGDPSSYARGANIHPISSLVSYRLFSPCCLTRFEDTPQIKLHIYIDDITTSAAPSDTFPHLTLADFHWRRGFLQFYLLEGSLYILPTKIYLHGNGETKPLL